MTMDIGVGHNRPPLGEELLADLRETTARLEERKAAILAAMEKVEIRDQEDLGKVGDLAKLIKVLLDDVETKRSGILAPVYEARDMLNGAADKFTAELEAARDRLGGLVDNFRAEQRRKAREQAEKQREAEEARAAKVGSVVPEAITPAEPTPRGPIARGDYGGKVGTRETLTVTITDLSKIPAFILQAKAVQEAIISTARTFAQKGIPIDGIHVERGDKTNFS